MGSVDPAPASGGARQDSLSRPARVVAEVLAVAERFDPLPGLVRRRLGPGPRVAVVLVYRRRNAQTVRQLVAQHPRARFALWALDEVEPSLADLTVGHGPGSRFALLNRMAEGLDLADDEWLVAADDDVAVTRGDLHEAAAVAQALGLDLVQPAHDRESHLSWDHTKRRRFTLARTCSWVEIGPVVLLDAAARRVLLPFPEEGMGWGVELDWAAHERTEERDGLGLGVVDVVRMRHLVPMGTGYDVAAERARTTQLQASRGLSDADVHRLMETRRSFRRLPRRRS